MDFKEAGYQDVDWIQVAQDKVPVRGCCEPTDSIKGREVP
jgi:hypothetical protein